MDWTHLVTALGGASFTGLFAWAVYRVRLEQIAEAVMTPPTPKQLASNVKVRALFEKIKDLQRKDDEDDEEEIVEKDERDAIDRAFDILDEQENTPGVENNVFPLAPRAKDQKQLVRPTRPKAEDKIIKVAEGIFTNEK